MLVIRLKVLYASVVFEFPHQFRFLFSFIQNKTKQFMNLFLLQKKEQTLMAEFILYITLHGQRSGRTHELRGECVFAFLNANQ